LLLFLFVRTGRWTLWRGTLGRRTSAPGRWTSWTTLAGWPGGFIGWLWTWRFIGWFVGRFRRIIWFRIGFIRRGRFVRWFIRWPGLGFVRRFIWWTIRRRFSFAAAGTAVRGTAIIGTGTLWRIRGVRRVVLFLFYRFVGGGGFFCAGFLWGSRGFIAGFWFGFGSGFITGLWLGFGSVFVTGFGGSFGFRRRFGFGIGFIAVPGGGFGSGAWQRIVLWRFVFICFIVRRPGFWWTLWDATGFVWSMFYCGLTDTACPGFWRVFTEVSFGDFFTGVFISNWFFA
jgi:hypothetical protein